MTRALLVTETLGAGGAERSLLSLVPALEKLGVRCEVATLHSPDTLAPELERRGVIVHRLQLRHRWDLPRAVWRLGRLARRFDVVHANNFFPGIYVGLTSLVVRSPVRVMTFHNLGYDSFPATTTWLRFRKWFDGLVQRHGIDRWIAVSAAAAQSYRSHLRLADVEVVPPGLDLREIDDAAQSDPHILGDLGVRTGGAVIAVVARFVVEKAHLDLIDMVSRLRNAGRDVVLVLVGDGPLRGDIEGRARAQGFGDHIIFAGYRDHATAIAIVAAADVVVSASTHEGFSLALSEAMQVGTPIVATAVGGVPELVGDAAILVPPRQPSSLADGVESVLDDDQLRDRLISAGRTRMRAFSADVAARRHVEIYDGRRS